MHPALSLPEPFYLGILLTHQSNTHSLCSTVFSPLLLLYFDKNLMAVIIKYNNTVIA